MPLPGLVRISTGSNASSVQDQESTSKHDLLASNAANPKHLAEQCGSAILAVFSHMKSWSACTVAPTS